MKLKYNMKEYRVIEETKTYESGREETIFVPQSRHYLPVFGLKMSVFGWVGYSRDVLYYPYVTDIEEYSEDSAWAVINRVKDKTLT